MGKVLVEASKVTCGHQGIIKMTGAARLVVGGCKVLTMASIRGAAATPSFPGCTNTNNQCTKINFDTKTSGDSTRLRVDGEFVALDSLTVLTDKAGTVTVDSASINNNLLEAQ
jgi:hypothetical protein